MCESNVRIKTGHAGSLLPLIDQVLAQAGQTPGGIDLIAVGQGPGSFTGIRIGIATARGLAASLSCPLRGVSTLDVLAFGLPPCDLPVMPLIDARKGEVFCAVYAPGGRRQTTYLNLPPEKAGGLITEPTLVLGNALALYRDVLMTAGKSQCRIAPEHLWHPRASVLARIARANVPESSSTEVRPIYVRASDADFTLRRHMDR